MTLIQATVHKLLCPQDFWMAIYENGRLWLTLQLIRDVRVATIRDTARHNNGTTWLEQKTCEPVARPVATSCSDLPRRPVWLDKSRHFVHIICTNKLHLVATCRDGRYGRTTLGHLYTIWQRCVNILPPCRDNHIMSYLCRATILPAIQNGQNKVCRAVARHVATRTSRMSCTVVPKKIYLKNSQSHTGHNIM